MINPLAPVPGRSRRTPANRGATPTGFLASRSLYTSLRRYRFNKTTSASEERFPFHAFTGLSFLSIFFDVAFEASMIDFWRSKFLLFMLKLIFDRFFGPLQNQEGALWGHFAVSGRSKSSTPIALWAFFRFWAVSKIRQNFIKN